MWWDSLPRTRTFSTIDRDTFQREIQGSNQPAIIKGLVSDWPLVAQAADSPAAFCAQLSQAANDKPVDGWFGQPDMGGRFFYSEDIKGRNFQKIPLPPAALFEKILATQGQPNGPHIFGGGINLDQHMPGILPQLSTPLTENIDYKLTSLWIGNRTRTAAHWDLPQNLACVIAGRRRFITFPIEQVKNLYFGPIDNTLAGQSISLVDFHQPDFERFPLFKEAMAQAEIAELEPGDALYMPSLRIHHVETLDSFGAMVNYWWREQEGYSPTPLLTLCHALMTLKVMPAQERQAWRQLFDYYIFDSTPETLAHIPEAAQGILGQLTPERQQHISQILLNSLKPQ